MNALRRPARILKSELRHISDYWKEIGVEMSVQPQTHEARRWVWRVWVTFDGRQSCSEYSEGATFRHPDPYTAQGRTRSADEAWVQARECADDVRRRLAEKAHVQNMTATEKVALS